MQTTPYKLARHRAGMLQADVARVIGIRADRLSGIENGSAEPTVAILLALARIYEIDVNELMDVSAPKRHTKESTP